MSAIIRRRGLIGADKKLYLIKDGIETVQITASTYAAWDYNWARKSPSVSHESGFVEAQLTAGSQARGSIYFPKISLSGYKAIFIDGVFDYTPKRNNGWGVIVASITENMSYTYSAKKFEYILDQSNSAYSFDGIKEMDISNQETEQYITFCLCVDPTGTGTSNALVKIRNLWLE